MRYCPKCRSEYQDWVKVCIDCGTELTDKPLDPPPVPLAVPDDNLITIDVFRYPTEAHLSKAKLEANGIWSFIADEYVVSADWFYLTAVRGVKLQVRESEFEDALEILRSPTEHMPESTPDENEICPRCQSNITQYQTFRIRPIFLISLLTTLISGEVGFMLPILKRKWTCKNCGYEWKKRENN
jgi:hypothetical protein